MPSANLASLYFQNGFPYLVIGPDEGYRLRDCLVYRVQQGQETESWDYWNPAIPAPAHFPEHWVRQFWRALAAAPHIICAENQWASDYTSLLAGTVVRWTDDRQQSACFLQGCYAADTFVNEPWAPETAQAWVRQALPPQARP